MVGRIAMKQKEYVFTWVTCHHSNICLLKAVVSVYAMTSGYISWLLFQLLIVKRKRPNDIQSLDGYCLQCWNDTNLICRLMTMAMILIIHLGLISNSLIILKWIKLTFCILTHTYQIISKNQIHLLKPKPVSIWKK